MPESSTLVALVGDTHGFLDPRVAAVARAAEIVVHTGDVGGAAILAELGADGARVLAVHGNNDTPRHWPGGETGVLERLPRSLHLPLPGGTLVAEHGHRFPARSRHRRLRGEHPQAAAVVCGHSHRRALDTEASPWVLNPGAAGRSRAYGGPGCLLLRAGPESWDIEVHAFERLPRRR